jgi:hypothetical protein
MSDVPSEAQVAVLIGEARHAVAHGHSLVRTVWMEQRQLLGASDRLLAREAERRLTQALSVLARMEILRPQPDFTEGEPRDYAGPE